MLNTAIEFKEIQSVSFDYSYCKAATNMKQFNIIRWNMLTCCNDFFTVATSLKF